MCIRDRARCSVVLIDEIDKAPADFPNDLLEEMKDFNFTVPEIKDDTGAPLRLGFSGDTDPKYKPFVLITSNAVRALPEAFLRRCVYYHMQLPDRSAPPQSEEHGYYVQFSDTIKQRVRSVLQNQADKDQLEKNIEAAWDTFWIVREAGLSRKPSTGEGLSWMLTAGKGLAGNRGDEHWVRQALTLLVKNEDDAKSARTALNKKYPQASDDT